jgi:hypothetical protein
VGKKWLCIKCVRRALKDENERKLLQDYIDKDRHVLPTHKFFFKKLNDGSE